MSYLVVKHLHVSCVALSGFFFLLRGVWMLAGSGRLHRRWVRIVPHIVDTLLLASALALVTWSAQHPFVQGWLTAKVVALAVYIVLGSIALKRGKTGLVRIVAFMAAVVTFAYIVAVAVTKQIFPFGEALSAFF